MTTAPMTATMGGTARSWRVAVIALVASVLALAACRVEVGSPAAVTPCADSHPTGKVVLYTSAYRELTDGLAALARQQLPDVELVIFQGGSEKVAGRLDADLAAGRAGADVLLVSDPLLSRRLKRDGQLLPWASPMATPVDRRLVDLDNAFVAARASTMVIAFHGEKTPRGSVPTSLAALLMGADDGVARDVAFGDPLSSGTALFTSVVVGRGDVSFLGPLRQRGAAIGGGNAVVLQRVLSGERRFGVVLLENVLVSRDRGEPVDFVVPTDAVVIPGDVAILKDTANPAAARAVVDLILSPAGQALMAGDLGRMHAVDPRIAPPASNIPPLATLLDNRPLDPTLLEKASLDRAALLGAIEGALLHQP
jgi:iron(III) transport system substrate-binding protein